MLGPRYKTQGNSRCLLTYPEIVGCNNSSDLQSARSSFLCEGPKKSRCVCALMKLGIRTRPLRLRIPVRSHVGLMHRFYCPYEISYRLLGPCIQRFQLFLYEYHWPQRCDRSQKLDWVPLQSFCLKPTSSPNQTILSILQQVKKCRSVE